VFTEPAAPPALVVPAPPLVPLAPAVGIMVDPPEAVLSFVAWSLLQAMQAVSVVIVSPKAAFRRSPRVCTITINV
jgi:hypothetical protein